MVVDGSFLKAAYKGTRLLALRMELLIKGTFGVREGMCIVSDRNESIFNAIKVVYPEDIFFALARAYMIEKFEYHITVMCKIDPIVQPYFFEISYEWWSRTYSKMKRSMAMTSNIAESIKAANKDATELPVMRLLEYMTNLLQQWNNKNRKVRPATEQLYTVFEGVRRNIVCLEEGTCSCKKIQMDELPCPHAWAVLKNQQLKPGQYNSFYYKNDKLLRTYEFPVNLMPDKSLWVCLTEVMEYMVLPPKGRRNAGRPREERLKPASEKESKRAFSCSVYGQGGHNRKICRNRPK
uniref:SWIM-type domain-containing protein n=1 Tax=Nicotiana tabacum TaxID=4097 RepID=A0A1S4BTX7_TOBAC|nr:PREDICTED: uncharacterized protein LOC107811860 [Nicotiana tabacum]